MTSAVLDLSVTYLENSWLSQKFEAGQETRQEVAFAQDVSTSVEVSQVGFRGHRMWIKAREELEETN